MNVYLLGAIKLYFVALFGIFNSGCLQNLSRGNIAEASSIGSEIGAVFEASAVSYGMPSTGSKTVFSEGDRIEFSIEASSRNTLTYNWEFSKNLNNSFIDINKNASSFVLKSAKENHEGYFRVRILETNSKGRTKTHYTEALFVEIVQSNVDQNPVPDPDPVPPVSTTSTLPPKPDSPTGACNGKNAQGMNPVIPCAYGYGIYTQAGRGGQVIKVTNLNATGSGSLKACIDASGPRVCVFEVSGEIDIKPLGANLTINNSNITIAGQTAPAPGITLTGGGVRIGASDVLIQHIRVRVGDHIDPKYAENSSALRATSNKEISNIVVDHCSFSWSQDQTVTQFNDVMDMTINNSIIAEGLNDAFHPKGPHSTAALVGHEEGARIAMIGNLVSHHKGRNPRSGGEETLFANNIVYNWGNSSGSPNGGNSGVVNQSYVGNLYIPGVDSGNKMFVIETTSKNGKYEILNGSKFYFSGNAVDGMNISDPWDFVENKTGLNLRTESNPISINYPALSAENGDLYNHVIANTGARPAERGIAGKSDPVDVRMINDLINRTGQIINCIEDNGTSRCTKNAGGWHSIPVNTRKLTLPVNPNGDDNGDGYTNLEEWLHEFSREVEGR